MTERIYYYDINGKKEPDIESMVAFLIDEGILFVNSRDYLFESRKTGHTLVLYILCNDQFVPGSDGEDLSYDEVQNLYELYKEKGWQGVYEFIAAKRGCPNADSWRKKLEIQQQ
jgi:hypothetical protein